MVAWPATSLVAKPLCAGRVGLGRPDGGGGGGPQCRAGSGERRPSNAGRHQRRALPAGREQQRDRCRRAHAQPPQRPPPRRILRCCGRHRRRYWCQCAQRRQFSAQQPRRSAAAESRGGPEREPEGGDRGRPPWGVCARPRQRRRLAAAPARAVSQQALQRGCSSQGPPRAQRRRREPWRSGSRRGGCRPWQRRRGRWRSGRAISRAAGLEAGAGDGCRVVRRGGGCSSKVDTALSRWLHARANLVNPFLPNLRCTLASPPCGRRGRGGESKPCGFWNPAARPAHRALPHGLELLNTVRTLIC